MLTQDAIAAGHYTKPKGKEVGKIVGGEFVKTEADDPIDADTKPVIEDKKPDYGSMKMGELKTHAKTHNIKVTFGMKKTDLVKALLAK